MPVGLQLLGNYFAEGQLLHAAHSLQQATDFHTLAPDSARTPAAARTLAPAGR
jgi:Asp-tRNA(Asn)/Glu-tRNA(Gln) amidotransferase A subunit family amidase